MQLVAGTALVRLAASRMESGWPSSLPSAQDFSVSQMVHPIDSLIELASHVSGLAPGDVIATGTHHVGIGPVQSGTA